MVKLSTWNLCLGLSNKKDYVITTLTNEDIDICLMQEVEIKNDFNTDILNSNAFKIEIENSTMKSRCATYIKQGIDYVRRPDLEGIDNHLVIIDVNLDKSYRIINLYRSFNPPNNLRQNEHFTNQIRHLKQAVSNLGTRRIIIGGDFNVDYFEINNLSYRSRNICESLNDLIETEHLIQLIDFPTWHRVVNNIYKESLLDHVYVKDPTMVIEIKTITPLIGDHLLIIFNIPSNKIKNKIIWKRSWKNYNKEKLIIELRNIRFDQEPNDPQNYWNMLEYKLLPIIDKLSPIVAFSNNVTIKSTKPNKIIKNKLNIRKRLIRNLKHNSSNELRDRISNLNVEIKHHFQSLKTNSIRRQIIPGNTKSLWDAVKLAKDMDTPKLPSQMYRNNNLINEEELPDKFADLFGDKVNDIVKGAQISNTVYNGKRKINMAPANFMTPKNVLLAVTSMKTKNCEGHDKIPQRILTDGIEILKYPLTILFNKIYTQKVIPEQWLISKIAPIHKKGNSNQIENYRPIANLCSASKIFERLILLRIQEIEKLSNIDLTGKSQYGFKKGHSTSLAGQRLQSVITRALDNNNFAIMSSIDLSAAFDVVNVNLLIKRLEIIGLPIDIIDLLKLWLTERYYYVSLDSGNSFVRSSNVGTIQGSILGPILYAMYVSPLLDLCKMTLFADDNYIVRFNSNLDALIEDVKYSLEMIIKWLRDSGLKVNDSKTEACLFYRKDHAPVVVTINNINIETKDTMNVLGVLFDSKLQWNKHIEQTVIKTRKALQAIYLIRKFFNKKELLILITSNYYSILYYNADIWLIPSLSLNAKNQLMSASAAPLKLVCCNFDHHVSYQRLHNICGRATPVEVMKYRHALLLHKCYNDLLMRNDWLALNFNQNFNARCNSIFFFKTNSYRVGNNLLSNRFNILNGNIPFDILNLPFLQFKLKMKSLFLL